MAATVAEHLRTLEKMRKVYPFENHETYIGEYRNMAANRNIGIRLQTEHKETGTTVTLETPYDFERERT